MADLSIRQKKKGDPENTHLTPCAYGENMMARRIAFLRPEIRPIGEEIEEHRIDFTYDVLFKTRNKIAFKTSFDDLRKSKTVLEVNVLFSSIIIIGLIVAVIMILKSILKRVVDNRPVCLANAE